MSHAPATAFRKKPWPTCALDDLADVFSDGDWIESKDQSSSGVRLLQTGNIGEGDFKGRDDKARFISLETLERLNCSEVFVGDILISRLPDPVGRACIVPELIGRMITAVDCTIARLKERLIVPKFFVYFTQSDAYLSSVAKLCTGTTRSRISRSALGRIEVPLPPLDEQKRIVAVLDQAFAALDRARANAEANLAGTSLLKQNVLDEEADSLAEKFGNVSVGKIASVKGGKRLPKGEKLQAEATPFPYITVSDMNDEGSVNAEGVRFVRPEVQEEIRKYTISSNDVYISIAGSIGKTGLVPDEFDGANLTENAAKLVLDAGWDKNYVYWITRSSAFRSQTIDQTRVTAQPKLALQRIEAIKIPNASGAEQKRLVGLMREVRAEVAKVNSAYRLNLADIAALRQSLLRAAFSGELS